jgi:Zn-dependent peptidase ImmA (M78 family)
MRNHQRLWREGYGLGETAREHLSPRQEPLQSVQGVLEAHQVHVARVPLGDERNIAVSIYEPGAIPVILLNLAASRVNQRLSRRAVLAHELCHLLHDGGEANLVTLVTREEDREPIERRANAFAPGFIAPRKWTRATTTATTPIEQVREIARTWGLTFEGAAWHAKNSEVITPEMADELVKRHEVVASECEPTLSRRDPASAGLDAEVTPLVAGLVQDMVVDAYAEGLISRGRAHELLTFA